MINLKELKQNLNRFAEQQAQRAEEYRMNHLLHEDTKFKFAYLSLEITRKCNLKCAHCMRGDTQHLSMSTEIQKSQGDFQMRKVCYSEIKQEANRVRRMTL